MAIVYNGSLLAERSGIAFRQLECREKDEKRNVAEWLPSAAMAASMYYLPF